MTLLGRWPLLLAFLALFLVHEGHAPPPGASSLPRTAASARLPTPSLEPLSDRSVPIAALSDDRADADENGHPPRDGDWKRFLHSALSGTPAGFERRVRLRPASAQAKWFYRAWGQP